MRRRLFATIVLLPVAVGCVAYFVVRSKVLGSANKTLKQAATYALNGKPELARDELQWLLWFQPHHPSALQLVGASYLKQNNFPAAIEHLQRIGETSPLHENAQGLLASALLADQQFEQAEVVLSRHVARYPKLIVARRQLSGLLLTELRGRDAIRVLEGYLSDTASNPPSTADLLLMLRDLSTAEFHPPLPQTCVTMLQSVLERHPDQPRVELALAQCHLRLNNLNDAEPLLQRAVARNSQEPQARLLFCELLLEQGDGDRAEAALLGSSANLPALSGKILEAFEQDDRYWELRCRIAEARGDIEHALKEIDRAIAIQPHSKDYTARRARLLQRLRRADEARSAYARSHELSRAELDLWRLSRDLGVREPNIDECEHVALLYESLGKKLQANAWRRLKHVLATTPPTESRL